MTLGHEVHVRQEITPRRVLLVGSLAAAAGTAIAIEAVHRHAPQPPSRLERHLRLDERHTQDLLRKSEFAGA